MAGAARIAAVGFTGMASFSPRFGRHGRYCRMTEKKKEFDAVKMMRDARDQISRDIRDMSFEEQAAYFREHAEQARKKLEATKNGQVV